MKPIIFSHSFLSQESNCPEAARHLFILRDFKKTYQVSGGIDAHKELEQRLRYKQPLPKELSGTEPLIVSLEKSGGLLVEFSLAVKRDLTPTKFFEPDAWLRGKYDVGRLAERTAFLGDWKTGKIRESDEQLELGALMLMAAHREIDTVTGANIWLNHGPKLGTPFTFKRSESGERWLKWVRRMQVIEQRDASQEWERRDSPLCKWCPVETCPNYRGG